MRKPKIPCGGQPDDGGYRVYTPITRQHSPKTYSQQPGIPGDGGGIRDGGYRVHIPIPASTAY
jgi:hypothetical protein